MLTAFEHNSLRFHTLQIANQDTKKAERLAREITGKLRKLPAERRQVILSSRVIDGWSGVIAQLDRE